MDNFNYSEKLALAANQNLKEKEYWINRFSPFPGKSTFPADGQADGKPGEPVSVLPVVFSAEQQQRLMKLRNKNDVRLNMVLMATVTALLYKYTGNHDITVTMPIYEQEKETQFINTTLPLLSHIDEHSGFKALLMQIRQTIGDGVEHQNYPMPVLARQLNLPEEENVFPFSDVFTLLENIHDRNYYGQLKPAVLFLFNREEETISGSMEYRPDLFSENSAQRMVKHLLILTDQLLQNIDTPLNELSMLREEEKNQILESFNGTTTDVPSTRLLHRLFEEQAEKSADDTAVISGELPQPETANESDDALLTLTYSQLNEKADQLAAILRDKGIGPDSIVGLLTDPCPALAAGILGILKSGGAYLPIDSDYPDERIHFMLSDSCAPILVTTPDLARRVSFDGDIILIEPNGDCGDCGRGNHAPTRNTPVNAPDNAHANDGSNLAYVIYTSGSTGRPKGVLVEHRNVSAYLASFFHQFDINANDTVISLTSLAFDAFVEEFYPVLLRGGKLVLPGKEDMMDMEQLARWVTDFNVTMLDCTPLMLNEFNKLPPQVTQNLRIIINGGDVLKPAYVDRLVQTGNVYNTYGPTESTVCATYYHYKENTNENIPIGKPIANYTVTILDQKGRIQPVGVAGEICVSGPGVTRGYLNRPELCAEKYITTSFNDSITYRTGDLGRWLQNGDILFLGRLDNQVKIRGYRIETGEIQTRIDAHPEIRESLVTIREDSEGEKFICAYVIPETAQGDGADTDYANLLRLYLFLHLPDYMIPSFFVPLEHFPLTPAGKIDKNALPEPKMSATARYVEPRNDIEKGLQEIWMDMFELERIGIYDDFFEIGGHSLKGIQAANAIHKRFNVKVGVQAVFQHPTIAALADIIRRGEISGFAEIQPLPPSDYYELSYAQKRMWILHKLNPGSHTFNLPMNFDFPGRLDETILKKAFYVMAQRHECFRSYFKEIEGEPKQLIKEDIDVHIETILLENLSPEEEQNERNRLVNEAMIQHINPEEFPLFRLLLITSQSGSSLLFNMHHMVTDGGSIEIFKQEFIPLYEALSKGQEPSLPPLRIQFKDFAHWQNALVNDPEGKTKALEFWKPLLNTQLPLLNLPYDFPVSQMQTKESAGYYFLLPEDLKDALHTLAGKHNASLFMVLLAALNVLLTFITGQEDIVLAMPGMDRRHEDLKDVMGLFVNTLILRNNVDKEDSFEHFLDDVRENTLKVLEFQSFPMEMICEELNAKFPDIQVFFNMINMADSNRFETDRKEAVHETIDFEAKFPLVFYMTEFQNGIEIVCHYYKELFNPQRIEKITNLYLNILKSITTNPATPITNLKPKTSKKKRLQRG